MSRMIEKVPAQQHVPSCIRAELGPRGEGGHLIVPDGLGGGSASHVEGEAVGDGELSLQLQLRPGDCDGLKWTRHARSFAVIGMKRRLGRNHSVNTSRDEERCKEILLH